MRVVWWDNGLEGQQGTVEARGGAEGGEQKAGIEQWGGGRGEEGRPGKGGEREGEATIKGEERGGAAPAIVREEGGARVGPGGKEGREGRGSERAKAAGVENRSGRAGLLSVWQLPS
jgi:hypothetical protein